MSDADDPRCPECDGPVSATATYCMHCDADLTDRSLSSGGESEARTDTTPDDTSDDGGWGVADDAEVAADTDSADDADSERTLPSWDEPSDVDAADATSGASADARDGADATADDHGLLHPEGLADNALTVAVGIAGGLVVGVLATFVLLVATTSAWGFLAGVIAWLVATAVIVRQHTVQGAVSRAAYGVAVVLLLVPLIAFTPGMENGSDVGSRVVLFFVMLVVAAVPAAVAAAVGWFASQFVPESAGG